MSRMERPSVAVQLPGQQHTGGLWRHIARRFWSHFPARGSCMCGYGVLLVPIIPKGHSPGAVWDELQHPRDPDEELFFP